MATGCFRRWLWSLPFIKEKLYRGKKVSLKNYYLRRLARLEPPYLAALLLSFILLVFVVKEYSFNELLPHLGVSSVYLHNIAYHQKSLVLTLARSLEIEVQFYILVPLLACIFYIRHHLFRRTLLVVLIAGTGLLSYRLMWQMPVWSHPFLTFFFSGMLLADWYCKPPASFLQSKVTGIVGLLLIPGLPFLVSLSHPLLFLCKLSLMILFFYLVLFNQWLKNWMSTQVITITGGMCYSIYLIHLMVLSGVSKWLTQFSLPQNFFGFFFYLLILLSMILLLSGLFYRLIEQPCMRRAWYINIFKKGVQGSRY